MLFNNADRSFEPHFPVYVKEFHIFLIVKNLYLKDSNLPEDDPRFRFGSGGGGPIGGGGGGGIFEFYKKPKKLIKLTKLTIAYFIDFSLNFSQIFILNHGQTVLLNSVSQSGRIQ